MNNGRMNDKGCDEVSQLVEWLLIDIGGKPGTTIYMAGLIAIGFFGIWLLVYMSNRMGPDTLKSNITTGLFGIGILGLVVFYALSGFFVVSDRDELTKEPRESVIESIDIGRNDIAHMENGDSVPLDSDNVEFRIGDTLSYERYLPNTFSSDMEYRYRNISVIKGADDDG